MNFLKEKGQGLVEYALLIVLVAVVVLGILMLLGPTISNAYGRIIAALSGGVISNVTVDSVTSGGSGYTLNVTVSVVKASSVTLASGGKSAPGNCSPPSCSIAVSGLSSEHGSFTVTAAEGGQFSGSY